MHMAVVRCGCWMSRHRQPLHTYKVQMRCKWTQSRRRNLRNARHTIKKNAEKKCSAPLPKTTNHPRTAVTTCSLNYPFLGKSCPIYRGITADSPGLTSSRSVSYTTGRPNSSPLGSRLVSTTDRYSASVMKPVKGLKPPLQISSASHSWRGER